MSRSAIPRLFTFPLVARLFILATACAVLNGHDVHAQAYKQVHGIIHIDTSISGGEWDPPQMVKELQGLGMEVAIVTDQITTGVKYGVFPIKGIMEWITGWYAEKKLGRQGSVTTYGPTNYLNLLDDLNRQYENIVVIPGVEVFPFYYWEGSLLKGNLTLRSGYKHLLAIGLDKPQDYSEMPTVGEGFYKGYNIQTVLSLWPLVLLFLGYKSLRKARRSRYPLFFKIPAGIFILVAALFLLNNFPYKYGRYDAYHGDQGYAPYQDFIDYVVNRGGLVFWAHPEVSSKTVYSIGPFKIAQKTDAPYEDLLYVRHITGFAAFYEGMKYIIPPGGIWDQVLTQYCIGQRAHPIWAMAECDVEGDAFDPRLSQTVFLVKNKTRDEILKSLREGRIYALNGPYARELELDNFELTGAEGQAGMGETLEAQSVHVSAHITLADTTGVKRALSAELIRNGVVYQTYKGEGEINIDLTDSLTRADRLQYYRIDVRAPNQSRLLTNPIFVRVPKS